MSCRNKTTVSGNVGIWFPHFEGSLFMSVKVRYVAEQYGYIESEKDFHESDEMTRMDAAEFWMNVHVVPEGYFFGDDPENSGGWGMFPTNRPELVERTEE
jgi:hypothetical protein